MLSIFQIEIGWCFQDELAKAINADPERTEHLMSLLISMSVFAHDPKVWLIRIHGTTHYEIPLLIKYHHMVCFPLQLGSDPLCQ